MNKNDIDPIHLQQVHDAVESVFPKQSWILLESIGGGLSTSILYKIEVANRAYVARLSDPQHPHNNLRREYQAMRLASEYRLAPALHYADEQSGVTIMDFIQGRSLNATSPDGFSFIDSLAGLVRTLHQGEAFHKDASLSDKVEFIFGQLQPSLAATDLAQRSIATMRTLTPLLNDASDTRPSHCDINPGNLLFDGRQLWLIDWAAAAQENFYFDLASCGNFFFYQDEEIEQAFLSAYFERSLTDEEEEKYARMRIFVAIYYGIMFIYLSGTHNGLLLSQQEIDSLPEYPQFLARVGEGLEQMDNAMTQQRLGFVYLKEAQKRMSSHTMEVGTD